MLAQHTQQSRDGMSQRVLAFPTIQDEGVTCSLMNVVEILGIIS
jgi:hypothetical protein